MANPRKKILTFFFFFFFLPLRVVKFFIILPFYPRIIKGVCSDTWKEDLRCALGLVLILASDDIHFLLLTTNKYTVVALRPLSDLMLLSFLATSKQNSFIGNFSSFSYIILTVILSGSSMPQI